MIMETSRDRRSALPTHRQMLFSASKAHCLHTDPWTWHSPSELWAKVQLLQQDAPGLRVVQEGHFRKRKAAKGGGNTAWTDSVLAARKDMLSLPGGRPKFHRTSMDVPEMYEDDLIMDTSCHVIADVGRLIIVDGEVPILKTLDEPLPQPWAQTPPLQLKTGWFTIYNTKDSVLRLSRFGSHVVGWDFMHRLSSHGYPVGVLAVPNLAKKGQGQWANWEQYTSGALLVCENANIETSKYFLRIVQASVVASLEEIHDELAATLTSARAFCDPIPAGAMPGMSLDEALDIVTKRCRGDGGSPMTSFHSTDWYMAVLLCRRVHEHVEHLSNSVHGAEHVPPGRCCSPFFSCVHSISLDVLRYACGHGFTAHTRGAHTE